MRPMLQGMGRMLLCSFTAITSVLRQDCRKASCVACSPVCNGGLLNWLLFFQNGCIVQYCTVLYDTVQYFCNKCLPV